MPASFLPLAQMPEWSTKVFYVYIMASGPRGVLYIGMTSDLAGRIWQHRERVLDGFTKRYWVDRLVYFERHDDAQAAPQCRSVRIPDSRAKARLPGTQAKKGLRCPPLT